MGEEWGLDLGRAGGRMNAIQAQRTNESVNNNTHL